MTGETMQQVRVVRAALVGAREMAATTAATAADFLALVRSLPSACAGDRVPGLDWTVAETVAHLVTLPMRATVDPRRARTVQELGPLNATCIDEIDERDLAALADALQAQLGAAGGSPDDIIELHAGIVADRPTATAYLLADLLVHGFDIARATGAQWDVRDDRAAVALRGCVPAVRPWVRHDVLAGPSQKVVLDLGDAGPAVVVEVGDGRYEARSATSKDGSPSGVRASEVLLAMTGRRASADPAVSLFAAWYLPI